jgi:hypothetical protein
MDQSPPWGADTRLQKKLTAFHGTTTFIILFTRIYGIFLKSVGSRLRHLHTHTRTHARTRARTHARTHTRARARTHTHTHTNCFFNIILNFPSGLFSFPTETCKCLAFVLHAPPTSSINQLKMKMYIINLVLSLSSKNTVYSSSWKFPLRQQNVGITWELRGNYIILV